MRVKGLPIRMVITCSLTMRLNLCLASELKTEGKLSLESRKLKDNVSGRNVLFMSGSWLVTLPRYYSHITLVSITQYCLWVFVGLQPLTLRTLIV